MCRILGYFGNAPAPEVNRRRAAALLFAGGPDDQSHECGRLHATHWWLGANRLAVTAPAGGDQPYRDAAANRIAVFNGEIYNHRELRERLSPRHAFADACDGNVILPLYEEHGPGFTTHLDGMYALAILDRRERRLLLATDPAGIKPLYYRWDATHETLYFASELPALLELAGGPRELRPEGIDEYFTARTVLGDQTIFRDVSRLLPGAVLIAEPGREPRISRPAATAQNLCGPPDGDAAADLRALLDEEVRSLLVADVPVATMNSGGLDSGLVTALAVRHHPAIHSFHIKYRGDWPADESVYAQLLATELKTTHHELVADPCDFTDRIGDVAWSVGANADPIALSSWLLFRAVKRAGFKAILTGDGADELFGGYARLADAVRDDSTIWAPRYVDSLAAIPRVWREQLYTDEFQNHLHHGPGLASERLEERVRGLVARHGERLAGLLAFEQTDRLPAYHLARVDTTSMAHGVEARVPFLQGRIVRFANQLASRQKIAGDGVKCVLYRAAEGLLPEAILRRPKQPFTLPVAAMLAKGGPLFEYAHTVLDPSVARRRGLFKPAAVARLLACHVDCPENATGMALWSLLVFEAFVTLHVSV